MIQRLLRLALRLSWLPFLTPCCSLEAGPSQDPATPAKRIIALAPHATELVYAAGAGQHLVASVAHSDYPPAARQLPRVGDAARLDRERILSLDPDLVIAWPLGNRPQDLEWIEELGIQVYRSEPVTLEDIPADLEAIGRLAGTAKTAVLAAQVFRARLHWLADNYARPQPLPVFYQLWPRPLMTIDTRHLISRVLELCGARSIFAQLTTTAAQVSQEAVLVANPSAIVAAVEYDDSSDPLTQWRQWKDLDAVSEEHLFEVPADLLHRPGPRILDGAQSLCERLAPVASPPRIGNGETAEHR